MVGGERRNRRGKTGNGDLAPGATQPGDALRALEEGLGGEPAQEEEEFRLNEGDRPV